MATRPKKSDLLITATRLANHDLVSEDVPGGRAYKAFMIRSEIVALEAIAAALEAAK
ncbi:MAG: hypothetical protein LCH61_04135 [Proteobacteria bacterium]|nr:hypothetical protein [Pseudomonadota bacterium]